MVSSVVLLWCCGVFLSRFACIVLLLNCCFVVCCFLSFGYGLFVGLGFLRWVAVCRGGCLGCCLWWRVWVLFVLIVTVGLAGWEVCCLCFGYVVIA